MRRHLETIVMSFVMTMFIGATAFAQTIDQKLLIVTNDLQAGGHFNIAVQVKGTSLPSENTLGSATIDVNFDNTMLTYVNATGWAFGVLDGYNRSATNNVTFIRVGVTGGGVDPGQGTTGIDIGASYTTWVQLNFTIVGDGPTNLTIESVGNAVGLFANHANDPNTGVINDQTLTAPVNIVNTPLPVQVAKFTAMSGTAGSVKLEWQTASEVDNYGFEVQRSGEQMAGFVTLAGSFQAGHGTSVDAHSYSFVDNTATSSQPWYRLKQSDLNGTVHYYEPINASVTTGIDQQVAPKVFALFQNYPNPFNPTTMIRFTVENSGPATLVVYNMLGQKVATLFNDIATAGRYQSVRFNATNLASGMYIYRLQSGSKVDVRKLVLTK